MRAMPEALLLLGPTGSGKTPLGERIEARGLAGRRCRHFDFGRQLRALAGAPAPPEGFGAAEVEFVRGVLASGTLLEDRDFHIAERLLRGFLEACGAQPGDLVVLNGLPRHTGQALAIEPVLAVRWVLCLECDADTVGRRIAVDTGGDRAGRPDDDPGAVRRRLELFRSRTAPLIEHYRAAGARLGRIEIGPDSRPEDALPALEELLRC